MGIKAKNARAVVDIETPFALNESDHYPDRFGKVDQGPVWSA
jgi:hypothetical protein